MTDDAQSQSSATSEQPTQVTPGTSAPTGGAPAAANAAAAPAGASAGTSARVAETHPPVPPPVPPVVETGPAPDPSLTDKAAVLIEQRPELGAGGAFVGGVMFALILKRIAR